MQHPLKMGVQILRLLDTVHQRHREHIGDYLTASEQSDRIIPFNVSQCRDKQVPHQQADKRIMRAVVARKPAYPLGDRQTDPHLNEATGRSVVRFTCHLLSDLEEQCLFVAQVQV